MLGWRHRGSPPDIRSNKIMNELKVLQVGDRWHVLTILKFAIYSLVFKERVKLDKFTWLTQVTAIYWTNVRFINESADSSHVNFFSVLYDIGRFTASYTGTLCLTLQRVSACVFVLYIVARNDSEFKGIATTHVCTIFIGENNKIGINKHIRSIFICIFLQSWIESVLWIKWGRIFSKNLNT